MQLRSPECSTDVNTGGALSREVVIKSGGIRPRFRFRSLRTRIILLAVFACLLLGGAGVSLYFFLESSQTAKLDSAQRHLMVLATEMRNDYAAQLPEGVSLMKVSERPDPPQRPPPPPPALEMPPPPPPREAKDDSLAALTGTVLRREPDIEGGFYSAKADALTGYAFPTHEGPGGRKEIPGKERPTIELLARKAASTGTAQKESFHGAHDAILFVAVPVQDGKQITGAAWLMQRMPGLEAGRSKQLLLGSLGFAAAAITCALLTFFITSEVNSGVQTVLAQLGSLEGSLGEHPTDGTGRPHLAEFEQVLERVDALSNSLKEKIENERALEDEVRHRQRLSALGQFAAGVAHELRNPLATIRLRTQMSQRTAEIAAVGRNSAVVLDEIARLDRMIERLLYFSRPIHLRLESTSLSQLCNQVSANWSERFHTAGVQANCHVPEGVSAICDESKLRQVLDNLFENARQSLMESGSQDRRIELYARSESGLATLEVCDNGAGLVKAAEARALEPFFTTKDTGTGLGLSISYEIVQAHGGDLLLRNRPEGGAVAIITLPAGESFQISEPLVSELEANR